MSDDFKKLDDREHLLLRPSMYIGSVSADTRPWFLDGAPKPVTYVPGLLKIANEIIDNTVDEHLRSGYKSATKVDITVTEEFFKVSDNGRGIPIVKHHGEYQPVLCWAHARTGTSFSENRVGPSANGVGSFCSNVFSTKFVGETSDGSQWLKVECSGNGKIDAVNVLKSTKPRGTTVTMWPDFGRFSVFGFDDVHVGMLKSRVRSIASTYPAITFTFNGEKIHFKKSADYLKMYGESFVPYEGDKFFFGVFPSDAEEYQHWTAIDGLEFADGGSHEAYISNQLVFPLRDLIKRKHKIDLLPAEIKRGMKLVLMAREFPNMKFDSQTKMRLSNPESEVKAFFKNIPFDKVAASLFKMEAFIQPIIELKLAKQAAADKRAATLAQKALKKVTVAKHVEAKSRTRDKCVLFLCEGDSAKGQGVAVRNPDFHGFFPLRGKPLNTYGMSQKAILDNKELANVMAITGLRFGDSSMLTYGTIAILADADHDGQGGIAPLLLNFFYHWPELFEDGRIVIVKSPMYIARKGKECLFFYTREEFEAKNTKGYEVRYIKGLATLRQDEYRKVIHDGLWHKVSIDNPQLFGVMFSSDANKRKEVLNAA